MPTWANGRRNRLRRRRPPLLIWLAATAVVALVVIGPKDLPDAIKGVAKGIQSLRRKVAEFQQQADELVREAKLDDVRNQIADVRNTISDIRKFDIKGEIQKTVDSDGTLTKTFNENPMGTASSTPAWTPPPTARTPAKSAPQAMVACAHCGLHLPYSDAVVQRGVAYCSAEHLRAGPALRP